MTAALGSSQRVTSGPPPAGTTGVRYEFTFTTGGFPEPEPAVTGLPAGLTSDQSKKGDPRRPEGARVLRRPGPAWAGRG